MPRFSPLVLLAVVLATALSRLPAQRTQPGNGPTPPATAGWHALTGGHVVVTAGEELPRATIILRDGRITDVLPPGSEPPAGAQIHDVSGYTLYPAFIDLHVPLDVAAGDGDADSAKPSEHWNPNVRPERQGIDGLVDAEFVLESLRDLGFGAAALAPRHGIFRGKSDLITIEDSPSEGRREAVALQRRYDAVGFAPVGRSQGGGRDTYPRSLMGAIALVRQTLLDVASQNPGRDVEPLAGYVGALSDERSPLAFDARDELECLRGARIAREFERDAILLGSGFEFRRLDAISASKLPLVLPLNFPAAPEVTTLDERESVTLRDLLTWEHAPTGPHRLLKRGVTLAFTTDRLDDRSVFHTRLARAVRFGLDHDAALVALTTAPAKLLGVEASLGKIAQGLLGNIVITDGRLGEDDMELHSVWIRGIEHPIETETRADVEGPWRATLQSAGAEVERIVFEDRGAAEVFVGDTSVAASVVRIHEQQLDLVFDAEEVGGEGLVSLHALITGNRMIGTGIAQNGRRFGWSARREEEDPESEEPLAADPEGDADDDEDDSESSWQPRLDVELPVPFGAYGRLSGTPPEQQDVVFAGADTIWTSADAGILTDASLWIRGGKVVWVGAAADLPSSALKGSNARLIDASGLHITPGLIDCHSHTGIRGGVNEGTQAVTAEVRIGDAIDPDDINWYRQLASGVTTVNQLHGSANPIGGQNAVVKIRWGAQDPFSMAVTGAPGGIKFALGENVKQSNWGDRYQDRYPQTRMGVEALMRERFFAAQGYSSRRARDPSTPRDLELEALAEILDGTRLIHCHSYRQDEILMLCRVAREFGFVIGTFQHGLECYKVAEALKGVSRGASVFTDWWAYKFEVLDAIPENAAILHEQSITVSLNSDSDELARRLNTEAAKAVKYGSVAAADALKFVTLHPAMQLGIDEQVGSLEAGKDADLAIWNADPLSGYARCTATYIDGRRYWSEDDDREWRTSIRKERTRLIHLLLTIDDADREGESPPGFGGRFGTRQDHTASRLADVDNLPGICGCCERDAAANLGDAR